MSGCSGRAGNQFKTYFSLSLAISSVRRSSEHLEIFQLSHHCPVTVSCHYVSCQCPAICVLSLCIAIISILFMPFLHYLKVFTSLYLLRNDVWKQKKKTIPRSYWKIKNETDQIRHEITKYISGIFLYNLTEIIFTSFNKLEMNV